MGEELLGAGAGVADADGDVGAGGSGWATEVVPPQAASASTAGTASDTTRPRRMTGESRSGDHGVEAVVHRFTRSGPERDRTCRKRHRGPPSLPPDGQPTVA